MSTPAMNAILLGLLALNWIACAAHAMALAGDADPALTGHTLLLVLSSAALGLFAAGAATPARSAPDVASIRIHQE
jgi:hypothetical protein